MVTHYLAWMPREEGELSKEREKVKDKKKEEGEREREREPTGTQGPVNRLVLNSNNVGNSKHFIQSKRKPQSLGCLCSSGSSGVPGVWWEDGGRVDTAELQEAGLEQKHKQTQPAPLALGAAGSKFWTTSWRCVDKNFRGFVCRPDDGRNGFYHIGISVGRADHPPWCQLNV